MNKIFFTLFFSFVFSFGLFTPFVSAATTPSLGVASTFSALAHTFTSTTIPYGANIFGDLGFATTTGVSVGVFGGVTHVNDATYLQAGIDQHSALAALNSQACTFTFVGAVDLATDVSHGPIGVYTPGVYCSTGAMSIGGAGTVSLSGAGTYIFRPTGALTTSDFSIATTTNGASPCDVFWTPKWPTPSVATALGLDTRFVGTVIEPVAAANSNITVGGGTKWVGRALAFDWGITTNPVIMKYVSITAPTCPVPPPPAPTTATLHIIKHVINNNGGTATASFFTLHVKGSGSFGTADVTGSPAIGVESPGTTYTLDAGTYAVSENAATGYTSSISGDCDASGNVTLASGGNAICTITNDDIALPPPPAPTTATLHIIKHVINNNGGTATASSFTLHVKGSGMGGVSDITGSPAPGVEFPGTSYTVHEGTYTVNENAFSGYSSSMSGDCDASGNVTLVAGEDKTCTITNDDIALPPPPPSTPGTLHVIKHVINNNGGTATASSFTLHVKGSGSFGTADVTGSPATGVETPGTSYTLNAGTYTVSENTFSGYTGSISGDCDTSGNITLASGGNAICTITNNDIAVPTVLPPPVIHITKVPTPLALPLGPGPVTYDYTVTNIGTIAMTNVTVTDNKCAPAIFISGDTNADTKLDINETWKYRCTATLSQTTTNTVIATGHGNGFTATDTTDATVIVTVPPVVTPPVVIPKLPNTGFAPYEANNLWNVVILGSIFLSITSGFYFVKRKQI